MQMLQPQAGGTGFSVFTDTFYTSLSLAVELHTVKIHTTGTVMMSKKNCPAVLRRTKLGNHECYGYQKDMKVICLPFQDKHLMTVLSTFNGPQIQMVLSYR